LAQASKQSSLKVKKMSSSSVHGDANVVTTYTGISFRDYVLKRLCGNSSNKWPKSLIVPLLTTIRDLHPDDKELKLAVFLSCFLCRESMRGESLIGGESL